MPPAANTVWASLRNRLPTTTTSHPAVWAAIAARKPAPPEPMTRTLETLVRWLSFIFCYSFVTAQA